MEPEEYRSHRRTSSCPDLTIYRSSIQPVRKRAQSLFPRVDDNDPDFLPNVANIPRVQSDSDINKMDRNRMFDDSMQPTELLARVFTALGNIKTADDAQSVATLNGINGFSDSQILSTEKHDSRWSIPFSESGFSQPPPKLRCRAASDFRAPISDQLEIGNSHDWTWSGSNPQIDEFMRLRKLNKKKSPDLYRAALALPKTDNPVIVNVEDGASPISPTRTIFDRLNPFKKRDDPRKMSLAPDHLDVNNYLDQTAAGRRSRISLSPYQNITPISKRRPSTYSMRSVADESSAEVLENTTIADLIRALEVMHTQAAAGDQPSLEHLFATPRTRSRFASTSLAENATIDSLQSQQQLPMINIFPPSTPTQIRDRRNSLRPMSTANTPLFRRTHRRQSTIVDLPSARRSSLKPSSGPPPYSENTPRTTHRRFSVRPTLLSIPPGQSPMPSIQATSSLQRRLSMRPSPLLTDNSHGFNGVRINRFGRSISTSSSNHSASPMDSPLPNHSLFLTPVNEAINRQANRPPYFKSTVEETSTETKRKRSESK